MVREEGNIDIEVHIFWQVPCQFTHSGSKVYHKGARNCLEHTITIVTVTVTKVVTVTVTKVVSMTFTKIANVTVTRIITMTVTTTP